MTDISIHINDDRGGPASSPETLETAARVALATGPASGDRVESAEISITLTSAARMRELNREYHGVDGATDVLAFPLSGSPHLLGDVYVCPAAAEAAARELGIHAEEEVVRLVIHGVLHLLGHDHPAGEDRYASEMFALQERLLAEVLGGT